MGYRAIPHSIHNMVADVVAACTHRPFLSPFATIPQPQVRHRKEVHHTQEVKDALIEVNASTEQSKYWWDSWDAEWDEGWDWEETCSFLKLFLVGRYV